MCLFFSFIYKEKIGDYFNLFQRGNMMKPGSFRIILLKEVDVQNRVVILDINFSDVNTKEVRRIRFKGKHKVMGMTK